MTALLVEQGALRLAAHKEGVRLLYGDILEFPLGRHDDLVDALGLALRVARQAAVHAQIL